MLVLEYLSKDGGYLNFLSGAVLDLTANINVRLNERYEGGQSASNNNEFSSREASVLD